MSGRLDARLIRDAARDLGGDANLPYTPRQLWYATCVRLESPELTEGVAQLIAGVLMITIGVVVGIFGTVFVTPLVPVGMVVFGMGVQRRRAERNRPTTRALAVSYDEFVREGLDPLRDGATLGGLIDTDGEAPAAPDAGSGSPVVVCDRPETTALLAALAAAGGVRCRAVDESALGAALSVGRLHALHDADPRGCALALRLAAAGAAEVVDIGLRPAQITGRRIQVIQGAPTVVAADLGGLLTPDELVWLADGHRVELAILTPDELAAGVTAAMEAPPVTPPGAAPAAVALAGGSLVVAADEAQVPAED